MLDMKKSQIGKLSRGDTVQIKPEMVGSGMPFKLSKDKIAKLMKSKLAGKASRIKLTEAEMTGSGIMKKIKRTRTPCLCKEEVTTPMKYNTNMVDMVLPAARPLIQVGNAANGDMYIKSGR